MQAEYLTENSGSTPIALTATGDDWTVSAPQPIDIVEVGFIVTTTFSSSGNTVVKYDKRVTAGSDSGRGDGDVATLSIPTATAAGKQFRKVLATPIPIDIGEQVVGEVTTASTSAGSGIHYVKYRIRPAVGTERATNLVDQA